VCECDLRWHIHQQWGHLTTLATQHGCICCMHTCTWELDSAERACGERTSCDVRALYVESQNVHKTDKGNATAFQLALPTTPRTHCDENLSE
jgi:hypothetical protein